MHFPIDTAVGDSVGHAHKPRKAWRMLDGEVMQCDAADPIEPTAPAYANQELQDLNVPLQWYEGRVLHRRSKEETQRLIGAAQRRLEQNTELLEQLPPMIDAQTKVVEANAAQLASAKQRAQDVQAAERAWHEQANMLWKAPQTGVIYAYQSMTLFDGDVWLDSRQCYLRDTSEFRRYKLLEARGNDSSSAEAQAVRYLTQLQDALRDEKAATARLLGRLDDLRRNVEWWDKELRSLDEPLPSPIPTDPAVRAHLLKLKKEGRLHGELLFSA